MNPFLERFGFTSDPFEFTNADEEPLLTDYFVPPPYFSTVLGDPSSPRSHIVLAPRGSGKTAQRRMVEADSRDGGFLCVTYDTFDQPPGFSATDATWAYHVNQVCRLVLMAILMRMEEDPDYLAQFLTDQQKQILKISVGRFLGSLSAAEFERAIRAIKSFGDKAGDFWRRYAGPVAAAIQVLMNKAGLGNVNVPAELAEEARRDDSLRYYYEALLEIATALGFSSTYVLVDKVDESSLTGGASDTWNLIKPLVTDLPTLETPHVAFKFFLWDALQEPYVTDGGRPDRVELLDLSWTMHELSEMLARRLAAYSEGSVSSFNDMLCEEVPYDAHKLLAYVGANSPRDMIRVAKSIVDEQTRTSATHDCIDEAALWSGVARFSDQRAHELFGAYLGELQKVNRPTFVLKYLASDVFHISTQAAGQKVQSWMGTGIVKQVGERPNPGKRPMHLFGVVDLRVAIVGMPGSDVAMILGNYAIECPSCKHIVVSDEAEILCLHCGHNFKLGEARSLLEVCARSPAPGS